ncbi:MAG: hypothetical protein ACODAJ_05625 [Planctomycetota bacterium]
MAAPTLRSVSALAAQRPLKLGEALGILRDAARALAQAHARGSVHGAVCAENLVLDGRGVTRLVHDALRPPTRSPEQDAGRPPDARSDIYGLGATVAALAAHVDPLPEPFARLLTEMTAADPAERYQSMQDVLLALEACELMTGQRAVRPGREAESRRERRGLLVAVIVALGAVVMGMALLAVFGTTPPARGTPPESHKELLDKLAPLPDTASKPTTKR